jgi:hypothetical protein
MGRAALVEGEEAVAAYSASTLIAKTRREIVPKRRLDPKRNEARTT